VARDRVVELGANPEWVEPTARLMASLKPDWFPLNEARESLQLRPSWILLDRETPCGWLSLQPQPQYRTVEIYNLGLAEGGDLTVGAGLEPLLEAAERWAWDRECASVRFVMGSQGLSIHGRSLGAIWSELKSLRALERPEYEWFGRLGYLAHGLLPDTYGDNYHGVLLLKTRP